MIHSMICNISYPCNLWRLMIQLMRMKKCNREMKSSFHMTAHLIWAWIGKKLFSKDIHCLISSIGNTLLNFIEMTRIILKCTWNFSKEDLKPILFFTCLLLTTKCFNASMMKCWKRHLKIIQKLSITSAALFIQIMNSKLHLESQWIKTVQSA